MIADRRPLTVSDAVSLATLCEAAIHGWKVGRLLNGDVVTGTARAIAHPGGGFAGSKDDIRDLCLHVTLTSGFEAWWPIAELVDQLRGGEFVAPYEP